MTVKNSTIVGEAKFLLARLDELEFVNDDDLTRQFYGHVWPSAETLRILISKYERKASNG